MSKRFGPPELQGLDPGENNPEVRCRPSEVSTFGYRKAANDKKVPDPVGSEVFVLQKRLVEFNAASGSAQ